MNTAQKIAILGFDNLDACENKYLRRFVNDKISDWSDGKFERNFFSN